MYRVEIINNGIRTTIHNPLPDQKAAKLLSGSIKKEVNAIPSFTFEMAANNPGLRLMYPYKTRVEVKNLQTGKMAFEGRVLMPTPSMSNSGEIRKKIVCEGVKAYLHDSTQPYLAEKHWEGDGDRTGLEEFIDFVLENHNSQVESYKKIYRGIVDVKPFESSDDVTKGLNYQKTYKCIEEKLVGSFGGEFDVRRGTDGLLYLDYVEEFGSLKNTKIALGVNMQSISQESDPTGMVTRLIPLGAKKKDGETETEERLTIESVNDGENYVIDEEAENVYGIHYATVEFDDVTTAAALKSKGQQWLIENNRIKQKNTVTALELGLIDKRYELFELYNRYPIENDLIGVDINARVTGQTIDIVSPEKSTMTFGDKSTLLSDYSINQEKNTGGLMERVETVEKNYELNKEMIASTKSLTVTLSNESHTVSTDASGNGGDFTDCKTTLQVYSGTEDVTDKATYTLETSDGITGAFDMATHTYSVTGLSEDNGYVDFEVSYNGTTVTKRFVISKAKRGATGGKGEPGAAGADGRVYILETSDTAIKKGVDNVLTPASVTFRGFYRDGSAASRTAYAGRFKIEESTDGSTFAVKYTSGANESSKVYTPSSSNVKVIRCTMYAAGGTTNALDTQSVVVLADVEGMEVGGKQLLRGTASPKLLASGIAYWENGEYRYVSGGDGVGSIEEVLDSPVASVTQAFVMKNNTTGNKDFQQTYMPIINGQTYTFSAWVKGSGRLLIRMWHSGANVGQNYLNEVVNATEWTRVSGTVIADIPEGTTSTNTQFGVSGACEEMMFIAPKLEVGNIPTDWTPAPEDTASDIKNAVAIAESAQNAVDVSLDVIVGTQTAATGAWTGKAKFSELKDGQQIVYWLPYAGSGNATLNLTLADGTTTGAVPCYYNGTTRLTTHYVAGSAIRFVYRAAAVINGSTHTGWWADANYDSGNTYDRTRYSQAVKCGTAAIVAGNVIVGKNGVYQHLKSGASFDITYQILYASQAIAASGTNTWTYVALPFTVTTTQSITLTAYKPVYIKGKLSGTTFTPVSTTPLTQAVPTTADGYHYILLGQAYSTTAMYLLPEHPIFMYHNGAFKSFEQIAAEAAAAAANAQNDIDNLQIGGRNLLLDSDRNALAKVSAPGNRYWSDAGQTNVTPTFVELSDPPLSGIKYGAQFTVTADSTLKNGRCLAFYNGQINLIKLIDGETYIMSCYARCVSGANKLRLQIGNGSPYLTQSYDLTEEWRQYTFTHTYQSGTWTASASEYPVWYFGCRGETESVVQICGFQLEKGNRATDWSPAPEDVQDSIDKVQNDVANMTKTVFSASTPTDTSVLWIDTSQTPPVAKRYNPDTVSWEVVNDTTEIIQSIRQDVGSLIDQIPERIDMWAAEKTYLKGEVDKLVSELKSELELTKEGLDVTISRLESNIEDTSGKLNKVDFAEYATYFNFRETGMYIGKNDSMFKLRLINDRISFLEGDVEVAYISNQRMYITELEVTGNIIWADWGFTVEANGSRSFGKIR